MMTRSMEEDDGQKKRRRRRRRRKMRSMEKEKDDEEDEVHGRRGGGGGGRLRQRRLARRTRRSRSSDSFAFLLSILCAADSQMSTSTLPTSSQGPVVAMAATTRRDPFMALGPMKGSCCTPTRACAGPMEICL